jgi:hypothetical protein
MGKSQISTGNAVTPEQVQFENHCGCDEHGLKHFQDAVIEDISHQIVNK